MGTVGLSFGSPTSGAGFDVSKTVAQIVGNLRAIESPWKNQLTKIENQDTELSNLGGLLSNLSKDIGQFTDFQGVLATKSGSSSDNNVLQLTGATPAAVAGTHTIVVTSLAQTSSGYLDLIADPSDILSGSVTLKVGNGTAQTIEVGATNNTLKKLSSSINALGIGVIANVITDANGSRLSLVSAVSGAKGDLSVTSNITDVTTSGTALAYNLSQPGLNANLSVDGVVIASASNTVTNVIPGVTFQLLSNAPNTQVQVVVANNTISVEGVLASFVSDYNAVITAINAQEKNDSSGNPEPLFGSPTLSAMQQQVLGALASRDPSGYIDPVQSTTDTLTGSITIQVGGSAAQTIAIDPAKNTLEGLASTINAANIGVDASIKTDATGSYLELISMTVGAAGALTVSSTLSDTTTNKTLLYNNSGSQLGGLTGLGVSVKNDGTLAIDGASLSAVLNNNYSGVIAFFQNANSWGQNFTHVLNNVNSSSSGIIGLALSSDRNVVSNLNADIAREERAISIQERSLTAELNSVNQIMQSLPSLLNQTNQLYAAITGYRQNG